MSRPNCPSALIIGIACLAMWRGIAASELESEPVADEIPITDIDRAYWAFQPIQRPELPATANNRWSRTPVDRFILGELESEGLDPLPEADRTTLIRRVTFDLTGLPPTPDEIDRFLADHSPDAYERLVDRLLASTAYGERWGMHWLDLARFAETDGFEHDKVRPEAWRYRDWLIRALNDDLPYDRLVALQLAADQVAPWDPEAQLATGFLLAGPDMPDINLQEERRHVFLNSMTANVGEVLLGLQFGCCQCHDHKADPISQRDFYRLRACFEEIELFQEPKLPLTSSDGSHPEVVQARVTRTPSGEPDPSRLWVRGDFRRPGPIVQPAVLRAAVASDDAAPLAVPDSQLRRQLADWMVAPDNPLTPRVIVNRLWQYHFGVGLAATTSDFGLMGVPPSHPELLDWLASELIRQEWSLKSIHRLLVTSAVYRTASKPCAPGADEVWRQLIAADPENHLLGRMRRRRLEGEAIRDAMLAVSGRLNRQAGGPGIRPPLPAEVVQTLLKDQWPVTPDAGQHDRRSVYLFVRRNLKYPLFDVFDRPDQNLSCCRRQQTTIAPQALAMLNSEVTQQCADSVAARITAAAGSDAADRIVSAYRLLLGRLPTDTELDSAVAFVASDPAGWRDLCLALLNVSEFVYVD